MLLALLQLLGCHVLEPFQVGHLELVLALCRPTRLALTLALLRRIRAAGLELASTRLPACQGGQPVPVGQLVPGGPEVAPAGQFGALPLTRLLLMVHLDCRFSLSPALLLLLLLRLARSRTRRP